MRKPTKSSSHPVNQNDDDLFVTVRGIQTRTNGGGKGGREDKRYKVR